MTDHIFSDQTVTDWNTGTVYRHRRQGKHTWYTMQKDGGDEVQINGKIARYKMNAILREMSREKKRYENRKYQK